MLKGPIVLGTIRTSFVLGLRLLIQAGTLLMVARMLGPVEFGAFAGVAALAVLLGALSTFGTNLILFEDVSKRAGRRDEVLSYAIPVAFICGVFLLGVLALIASWLTVDTEISLFVLLAIGVTEVLLQPFLGLMATEHHALGRIARSQLLSLSPMVLRFLTAACIFLFGFSPALSYYAIGYVAASILALTLGVYHLPKLWPVWRSWRLPKRAEWCKSFGYASISISKVGSTELDKTLALKLLSLEAAGIYTAATRVASAIILPVAAMTHSALPRLFRESCTQQESTQHLLQWMYGAGLAYSLCLAGALWLVAPVLSVLFGDGYQSVQEVVRWLCLAIPGIALRLIAGNVLIAMGRPWSRVGFEMTGLLVLSISSIVFTKHMGLTGMPLAIACSESVMAIMGAIFVIKHKAESGKLS